MFRLGSPPPVCVGMWGVHAMIPNNRIFACHLLGFMVQGEDNKRRYNDNAAGCHPIQTNRCPHLHHFHHFYAGCSSCCNLPNLSLLGTDTKYAGLYTQSLGYICSGFVKYTTCLTMMISLQCWLSAAWLVHQAPCRGSSPQILQSDTQLCRQSEQ